MSDSEEVTYECPKCHNLTKVKKDREVFECGTCKLLLFKE